MSKPQNFAARSSCGSLVSKYSISILMACARIFESYGSFFSPTNHEKDLDLGCTKILLHLKKAFTERKLDIARLQQLIYMPLSQLEAALVTGFNSLPDGIFHISFNVDLKVTFFFDKGSVQVLGGPLQLLFCCKVKLFKLNNLQVKKLQKNKQSHMNYTRFSAE